MPPHVPPNSLFLSPSFSPSPPPLSLSLSAAFSLHHLSFPTCSPGKLDAPGWPVPDLFPLYAQRPTARSWVKDQKDLIKLLARDAPAGATLTALGKIHIASGAPVPNRAAPRHLRTREVRQGEEKKEGKREARENTVEICRSLFRENIDHGRKLCGHIGNDRFLNIPENSNPILNHKFAMLEANNRTREIVIPRRLEAGRTREKFIASSSDDLRTAINVE